MPKSALKGLKVIVTRPDEQADVLCDLISAAGGEAIKLPLLSIEQPSDPERARKSLDRSDEYDWLIFTSANAAKGLIALSPELTKLPANKASIGAATAKAVAAAGMGESLIPDAGSSSEALLKHPALEEVYDKKILIIKGEGGRDLLSKALINRGATVDSVDVYQRKQAVIVPKELHGLAEDSDVLIVTSGGALEYLASLAENSRSPLYSLQLVVPSQRVVQMAEEQGFICTPLVPRQISDQAILEELVAWRKKLE